MSFDESARAQELMSRERLLFKSRGELKEFTTLADMGRQSRNLDQEVEYATLKKKLFEHVLDLHKLLIVMAMEGAGADYSRAWTTLFTDIVKKLEKESVP